MTVVQSKVLTVENEPIANLRIRVFLYTPSEWLEDGEALVPVAGTTVTNVDGEFSIDLIPNSQYEVAGSYYGFLIPGADMEFAVVPDYGPVQLYDIRVEPEDLTPTPPPVVSLYLLRSERGIANGVASLDSAGKIPVGQLPAGAGGDLDDYYTSAETDALLAGKAASNHTHAEYATTTSLGSVVSDIASLEDVVDSLALEVDDNAQIAVEALEGHVEALNPHPQYDDPTRASTPLYVAFSAGNWPSRPVSARMVFWVGGTEADEPSGAVSGDVWIPESD